MRFYATRRRLLGASLAIGLAATAAVAPTAQAGATARYVSGGTAVVRADGVTFVDNGGVVCDTGDSVGAGGFCVRFGGGDSVRVFDRVLGHDVAFQVCIDNNGDGFCTSPDPSPVCADQVYFSHDEVQFYNPLGPLPTGFAAGCPGGPWRGYVVHICEGVHVAATQHGHPASSGLGEVTTGGTGYGDFCGAPTGKPYVVQSGNHTCGMSVATDTAPDSGDDELRGTLVGGPWRVAGAIQTTMECFVVVDGSTSSYSFSTGGTSVVLGPTGISFEVGPDADVRLCTRVSWTGANGGGPYNYDADLQTAGVQCPQALVTDNAGFRTVTVPQTLVP